MRGWFLAIFKEGMMRKRQLFSLQTICCHVWRFGKCLMFRIRATTAFSPQSFRSVPTPPLPSPSSVLKVPIVALILLLARQGQIRFQNPQVWNAQSIIITEHFDGCHLALLCFTNEINPFHPSPLGFRTIAIAIKKNEITCYIIPWGSSFWLLQSAARQIVAISFARNRETTSEDKWNYVDFTLIARILELTSLVPFHAHCCFTRTWTKMASFSVGFSAIQKITENQ